MEGTDIPISLNLLIKKLLSLSRKMKGNSAKSLVIIMIILSAYIEDRTASTLFNAIFVF